MLILHGGSALLLCAMARCHWRLQAAQKRETKGAQVEGLKKVYDMTRVCVHIHSVDCRSLHHLPLDPVLLNELIASL